MDTVLGLTPLVRTAGSPVYRQRLVAELESVRVALEWAAAEGEVDFVVQLVRGLHDHVVGVAGREIHAWVERSVSAIWENPDAVDVLLVGAEAAMTRGDIPRYREILEQVDLLLAPHLCRARCQAPDTRRSAGSSSGSRC